MPKEAEPTRVEDERRALSCPTCGAGNRLAPHVIERGFQRCTHCGAAMPVRGAGSFAIEVGDGGFTRVVSPGRSLFVLLLGRVVSPLAFLLLLLLGEPAAAACRHVALALGAPAAVGWAFLALWGLVALAAFCLLCVEQRLLVTQNRVEITWRLFGIRVRHRRFGTHRLRLSKRTRRPRGLVLTPATGRPLLVFTETEHAAGVLERELGEAIREARVPAAEGARPCPGCGAPVATSLRLIEEGGVECGHCGSALVATKGGVVLGGAELALAASPVSPPPRVDRRPQPDGVEWRLPPELFVRPFTALSFILGGLGCGGLLVAFGVFTLLKTTELRAFGLLLALILVPLGLGLAVHLMIGALGRHRVRVDAGVLEHEVHLGPLRVRRRRLPLARLLSLSIRVGPGSAQAKVRTAVEETGFELPTLAGEGAVVSEQLLDEVQERLEAMGRAVKRERSNEPPPVGAG